MMAERVVAVRISRRRPSYDGQILVDGQRAGSFSAYLVKRAGKKFYAVCEAKPVMGQLQQFSNALFSSNGAPRYPALKSDASVAHGGFLHSRLQPGRAVPC